MSREAIEGLKPEMLWQRFYELTQIPRPSKHEAKVVEYLKSLSKKLSLECREDSVGNIVILLPASRGFENAPTVVLQSHVDMVCEKNKGTDIDFNIDPIEILRDGDWIKADGTTLGADNGIGAAAALAVLTDESIQHGPIECLFTVDEETGLTGANNLQPGFISGKILLNLDSEEDGAFYVGCAGGQDTMGEYNIPFEPVPAGLKAYSLMVSGLLGGHSGMDIITGRGNAIKILARALKALSKVSFHISRLEGGSKRNAIAREAEAIVHMAPAEFPRAEEIINRFYADILKEYSSSDPGVKITLTESQEESGTGFESGFTRRIIDVMLAMPHGVISMSPEIEGLVETSTNLATVVLQKDVLRIGTSQRSSLESAKKYIASSVAAVFSLSGANVLTADGYPGWKPDLNSPTLKTAKSIYQESYKAEPLIKAIHAGLECGILGDKYPGLDMISFGPSITGAHSPDERVNIPSVGKFYELLKSILEKLAKQ